MKSRAGDEVFDRFPELAPLRGTFVAAVDRLAAVAKGGGTLFVCGNGGSAADAEHIVGELMKGFRRPGPVAAALRRRLVRDHGAMGEELAAGLQRGIRAVALTGSPALATAIGNDMGPQLVFAQQLQVLARPGDALLAISTSGDAANVVRACAVAGALGLLRLGLTGATGGRLRGLTDLCLCVPATATHLVQELHVPLYHALCARLEEAVHGRG